MANVIHKDLSGAKAVHQFAYVQATDPGAVGASKAWVDTDTTPPTLKVRNAANNGWIVVSGNDDAADVIEAFAYVQAADPGTVGAFKAWVDTDTTPPTLKVRNAANNGWLIVYGDDDAVQEEWEYPALGADPTTPTNGETWIRDDLSPPEVRYRIAGTTWRVIMEAVV